MEQAALWAFFIADVVGVLWCLRVLVREAAKHLSWYRVGRHEARKALHADAPLPGPATADLPLPAQRRPTRESPPVADTARR